MLSGKFAGQLEQIFAGLPKSIEWHSYYRHDLPLVTDLDPEVRDWAIKLKLNKSQAKAINELNQESPDTFNRLMKDGASPQEDLGDYGNSQDKVEAQAG